jgi:diguanylate cyclase (GGDEF)-like protein
MIQIASIGSEIRTPIPTVQNRAYATSRLAEEIERAKGQANYEFAILLVQFEGLTDITGRLGHAPTDDVWQLAVNVLVQDLRAQDLCSRLGGDEFLLVLPSASPAEARALVERLHARWHPATGSREAGVTLNAGCASYPGHGTTVEALFAAADESMYANSLEQDLLRSSPGLSSPGLQQVA